MVGEGLVQHVPALGRLRRVRARPLWLGWSEVSHGRKIARCSASGQSRYVGSSGSRMLTEARARIA